MVVDMSMDSLPLFEAASFLDALATEKILVPEGRRNEPVSLDLQHTPFDEVVYQLGLKIQ